MRYQSIAVDDGDVLGALRGFLGRLLESGFVAALLVPRRLPAGDGFVQSLVCDPAMLQDADPVAPTMAVQSARILAELTASAEAGLAGRRIGAVLKPCELRASVELSKFLQVKLDDVVTIGVDCPGTFEVRDYAELARDGAWERMERERFRSPQAGPPQGAGLRGACRICDQPVPVNADLALGLFGADLSRAVPLAVGERFGEELAGALGLAPAEEEPAGRPGAVEALIRERRERRSAELGELKASAGGLDRLMQVLSTCVRCHNCMNACPICYCKECTFRSAVFEHGPDRFLNWAARKGAQRMPADTLLFHLTRMSHMAASCTGCGLCTSACPNRLPVADLFGLIGNELRGMFDYAAGMDAEEKPPLTVFKESELQAETGNG